MSIKSKYFEKIKLGIKKIEYRKIAPKNTNKIYFYVSAPIKRICGYIIINEIISGEPIFIWELTKENSGIDYYEFSRYCNKRNLVSAIIIKEFIELPAINPIEIFSKFNPPQNYLFKDEKFSTLV